MMMMRFICVCLSAAVLDRRLRCGPRTSSVAGMGRRTWRRAAAGLLPGGPGCGVLAAAAVGGAVNGHQPWSVLDGERHVQDARGGDGEGELALGAGVAAGAAGDRVHDAGLGEVGE